MLGVRRAAFLLLLFACSRELPEGAVRTVVERSQRGQRVIFVGLDGADWRLLDRFIADGTMPRLGEIVRTSERRTLMTQHPPLSPLVWTSMMTGVSPLEHRILDFTRFHPRTREQEPITSDERAVPAIWNIATYGGRTAGVFGMWATFPAEQGVIVTDRDLPRDYVAATEFVHRRASEWIREHEPDLAIVYFQGTDEIGHFTSGDVEKARAYFRRIDAIVGEYRDLAKKLDAQLIIASDHGFDWGGTHGESSTATGTAAKWHRDEGIFLRWRGRPARGSAGDAPAAANQLCATLIQALGLPRGEGMAPAIGETSTTTLKYSRYFQRAAPQSAAADKEQVAKLKALGYISSTASASSSATGTRTPQSFNNEGLILRAAGRADEAERAFVQALTIDAKYASARQNLDDLRSARGLERLRARDCRGALADLRGVTRESALLWASIAAAEGCVGNDDAAEAAVRRSLALDPNQPALRALLR